MFPASLLYLNIYFESIGFSATQIGLMNSVARGLAILILPIWGMLADYFGANKKALMLVLGGTITFMLSFLLTETYIIVFVLYLFYTIFWSPGESLSDAMVLNHLKEKSNEYGKIRVWGSAGYMATVIPFGFIIEQTQAQMLFFIAALVLFCNLVVVSRLPRSNKTIEVASLSDFKIILKNKKLFRFLVLILLVQAPLRANFIYFPIFFTEVGGGETLLAVGMVLAAGSEIFFFQKSDKFFDYFSSKNIFTLAAIFFAIRWLLIALFPVPNILIASQLLHGITFGLFHVTTVYYISSIVDDAFKATGQNIYASTISISTVISSLTGGIIYDNLGGANMYLLGGLISLLAGLGCYFSLFVKKPNQSQNVKLTE